MTWTSSCGLKTWDYICLDEQKMPVAKFSANIWGLKKVGYITFMGSSTPGAHTAGGNVSDASIRSRYSSALWERTAFVFLFVANGIKISTKFRIPAETTIFMVIFAGVVYMFETHNVLRACQTSYIDSPSF
ncbi:predicted protein [Histoplasma mississippiense (nom. inval.)]|uniref:predicted protein n=1 Tax=Ajellomyces capsulatus (strain NAm1 / WU24) TaxID=2059318 RepID=UPI000157B784|nr:predicted protein [Histoplasma mississippiense (nom. inval.)]EDN04112.1 predicted protein [Histoplasma mississippiense (nom. inval.)]